MTTKGEQVIHWVGGGVSELQQIRKQIESEMENIKKPLLSQEPHITDHYVINAWLHRDRCFRSLGKIK